MRVPNIQPQAYGWLEKTREGFVVSRRVTFFEGRPHGALWFRRVLTSRAARQHGCMWSMSSPTGAGQPEFANSVVDVSCALWSPVSGVTYCRCVFFFTLFDMEHVLDVDVLTVVLD